MIKEDSKAETEELRRKEEIIDVDDMIDYKKKRKRNWQNSGNKQTFKSTRKTDIMKNTVRGRQEKNRKSRQNEIEIEKESNETRDKITDIEGRQDILHMRTRKSKQSNRTRI